MVPFKLIQVTNSTNSIPRIIVFENESQMKKMNMGAVTLTKASIVNNTLSIVVSYSGGCEKHEFSLGAIFVFPNTNCNPVANLALGHENNNDTCKKMIRERLEFNLSPLKEKCQRVIGAKADSMILHLMNTTITVRYSFK